MPIVKCTGARLSSLAHVKLIIPHDRSYECTARRTSASHAKASVRTRSSSSSITMAPNRHIHIILHQQRLVHDPHPVVHAILEFLL